MTMRGSARRLQRLVGHALPTANEQPRPANGNNGAHEQHQRGLHGTRATATSAPHTPQCSDQNQECKQWKDGHARVPKTQQSAGWWMKRAQQSEKIAGRRAIEEVHELPGSGMRDDFYTECRRRAARPVACGTHGNAYGSRLRRVCPRCWSNDVPRARVLAVQERLKVQAVDLADRPGASRGVLPEREEESRSKQHRAFIHEAVRSGEPARLPTRGEALVEVAHECISGACVRERAGGNGCHSNRARRLVLRIGRWPTGGKCQRTGGDAK